MTISKIGAMTGVLPNSSTKIGGIEINSAIRKLSPDEAINDKIAKLKKVLSKITDKNSVTNDLTYFETSNYGSMIAVLDTFSSLIEISHI